MSDSSAFWGTMATVLPVLGLASVVEFRNTKWEYLPRLYRYISAPFYAVILIALGFSEILALNALSGDTVPEWTTELAVLIGMVSVTTVFLGPAISLVLIGYADFVPSMLIKNFKLWRSGRQLTKDFAERKRVLAENRAELEEMKQKTEERLDGLEKATATNGKDRDGITEQVDQLREVQSQIVDVLESIAGDEKAVDENTSKIKEMEEERREGIQCIIKKAKELNT